MEEPVHSPSNGGIWYTKVIAVSVGSCDIFSRGRKVTRSGNQALQTACVSAFDADFDQA